MSAPRPKAPGFGIYGLRVHPNSVGGTRGSIWGTWVCLDSVWFGPASGPLPLRVGSIKAVTAVFIRGGYRSIPNYVFVPHKGCPL